MIRANAGLIIVLRVMDFAVARQVATFLVGTRPVIKMSEISRRLGHDRSVEIDHGPIRRGASPDYAVRIVACRATVAFVFIMRCDVVNVR